MQATDSGKAIYNNVPWKNKAYAITSKYKTLTIQPYTPKYKTLTIKPKLTYKYNNQVYTTKVSKLSSPFVNNETDIEHLSEKMILIDGNEATEHDLKKLSAADIESMSVKSGDEMTQKYGDKAKNGVVFITTKKAEK